MIIYFFDFIYVCLSLGRWVSKGSMYPHWYVAEALHLATRYALEIGQEKRWTFWVKIMQQTLTLFWFWNSKFPCADSSFAEHLLTTLGRGVAWLQKEQIVVIGCQLCMLV